MKKVDVIDSHTGGEPTRVVVSGGPDFGGGSVAKQLEVFRRDHDQFRSAVVNEPRGSDVLVGAILVPPHEPDPPHEPPSPQPSPVRREREQEAPAGSWDQCAKSSLGVSHPSPLPSDGRGSRKRSRVHGLIARGLASGAPNAEADCVAGVIFFNNVGYLGMCGHGMIGLVVTLQYLGKIEPGEHRFETPVGVVTAQLHKDGSVSIRNVPSFRKAKAAKVNVEGIGVVEGDVAWGGNWFFLVNEKRWKLDISNVEELTEVSWRIRQAVNSQGFPEVDHVELFGPPGSSNGDSRNFVLCPGKAYDRSPCGTGTSAKLACLHADGILKPGQVWRQESITGSIFEGTVEESNGKVIPTIKGTAFVNSEARLLLNEADPLCWGIRPA